ncbi:ArsR/SmtB family transcription factor [Alteromonas sp. ASW11-130]|uniref:ArsR/SmtB family transcription factor n=1 Tax=Alteromonas sp. ASW11-130 TaxID=3015775 RepID=UPI002241DC39|nr:helix-turn-helix domain-containing protein [Alteromonas sp. ASW11-130]MCW8092447.1 helix-turn-helix domain-containing protein [Alteromonas sp. ASW11-130]
MTEADVFKALGDPTRLKIVKRLCQAQPCTIGELCKGLGISRQGARKQLQILVNANVASLTTVGRETKVELKLNALKLVGHFIAELEHQWEVRLNALKKYTEE